MISRLERRHLPFIAALAVLIFPHAGCRTESVPEPKTPGASPRAEAPTTLRAAGIFSDNMVLQQGIAVPIWGWADEGQTVTVTFRDQKVSGKVHGGKWLVKLKALRAGGPDTLTLSAGSTISMTNVLVGEVWVCSGQSNMEWPLNRSFKPDEDIAAATNPNLRLYTVPKLKSDSPVTDVKAAWQECTPSTVPGFSAVAWYFGRDLQKARNVPVGLIHTSWGGSPAEGWMSQGTLEANPRYQSEILEPYPAVRKKYQAEIEKWEQESEELKKAGKPARGRPWAPWRPAELYNGMIAPLIPYAIKGAIWYQGESNAGRAEQYRSLYPEMIRNWRRDWGLGDFPFLAVQLAPFMKIKDQPSESTWAELREAQLYATQILPRVGIAVITDVGDEDDIHPTQKGPVGARLALAARAIGYGEKIVAGGPLYKKLKIRGNEAVISFDQVGGGLEARGGALKGFAICGEDKKFVWAVAEIQGDTVVVSSPNVANPVAVRYGWADFPVVNLWNKEGLPASPFRTDNFPMTTAGRK